MSGMQAMAAAIFGGKSIDDGSDPELAAVVALVITRVAADHRDGFPNAGRLIRLDARAADFGHEQAARLDLSRQPHGRIQALDASAADLCVLYCGSPIATPHPRFALT